MIYTIIYYSGVLSFCLYCFHFFNFHGFNFYEFNFYEFNFYEFNFNINVLNYFFNTYKDSVICFYKKVLLHIDTIKNKRFTVTDLKKMNEEKTIVTVKYEDKYLERVRSLPEQYTFTEEEQTYEDRLFLEYLDEIKNSIKKEKETLSSYQQELSDMENIEFSEKDKNVTYDSDGDEIESFEERMNEKKEYYNTQIEKAKRSLFSLHENVNDEEQIRKSVKERIMNERLDKLKNNFIMEKTPLGNVLMSYNNKKETFEYYSDNTIPYRYLEVVSRKYVLTFNCRYLYVDMEEELKKSQLKLEEKSKTKELENKKDHVMSKNVFAKFKTYNKESGTGRVNKVPPPKNSIPGIKHNGNNEKTLLKERSNHYTCEGKLSNFNMLKKIDKKITDKKYLMSFAEFKKSIIQK